MERLAAEHASKVSFDETVKFLAAQTGAPVAKRQVEELVGRAAQDFAAFYESRKPATELEVHQTGPLLVVTGDAKGVRMHLEDLRPETRRAAEERKQDERERFTLGQKRVGKEAQESRKRMAEVAAVFTLGLLVRTPEDVVGELRHVRPVKATRPRPEGKTLFVSVTDSPDDVLELAFLEGLRLDPDLSFGIAKKPLRRGSAIQALVDRVVVGLAQPVLQPQLQRIARRVAAGLTVEVAQHRCDDRPVESLYHAMPFGIADFAVDKQDVQLGDHRHGVTSDKCRAVVEVQNPGQAVALQRFVKPA